MSTPTTVYTSPRFYIVTTASGHVYRRNRKWLHKSSEPPPLTLMEDAGDDHTNEQYKQHGAPATHNPEIVQPGLSAECETADSPNNERCKRQYMYENRADRNDHQFGWQTLNMLKQ